LTKTALKFLAVFESERQRLIIENYFVLFCILNIYYVYIIDVLLLINLLIHKVFLQINLLIKCK